MYILIRLRGNQVQILILNSFTKSVASHNKTLQPAGTRFAACPRLSLAVMRRIPRERTDVEGR